MIVTCRYYGCFFEGVKKEGEEKVGLNDYFKLHKLEIASDFVRQMS